MAILKLFPKEKKIKSRIAHKVFTMLGKPLNDVKSEMAATS